MALESPVNFLDDLVAANPTPTDPKSEGDDHIRNIKTALLASFPNIDGAVNPTPAELNLLVGKTALPSDGASGLFADLIATGSAASDATIELVDVFSDTYEDYIILINKLLPASSAQEFRAQLSNDSGVSWDSTANYYYQDATGYAYFKASNGKNLLNTSQLYTSMKLSLSQLRSATEYAALHGQGAYWASATDTGAMSHNGMKKEAGPWDSIKFYFASGNISTGEFSVWGVRKT